MFSHEKLIVYLKSIDFVAGTQPLIESFPAKISARDQLDRASTSLPLNIVEGTAKFSRSDRARFFRSLRHCLNHRKYAHGLLDVSVQNC
jgi:four helix bundle protein